jgi:hypothetical protein
MDTTKTFPLELDYDGNHYSGTILPSDELDAKGLPVFYRVELDGKLFAYICCGELGWQRRDEPQAQSGLINAIGNYILEWYE